MEVNQKIPKNSKSNITFSKKGNKEKKLKKKKNSSNNDKTVTVKIIMSNQIIIEWKYSNVNLSFMSEYTIFLFSLL